MSQVRQEADIQASAETVFAAIVDLRGYERWLTSSSAFAGITDISPGPVGPGTTWTESTPMGVRHGTITLFEPPTRVTFHEPMTVNPRFLGVIEITVSITLTPRATSVHVGRVVDIGTGFPLNLVQPFVVRQFRTESRRTMLALKDQVERSR